VRTDLEKARIDLINARAAIALTSEAVGLRRDRAARVNARVSAGQDARAAGLAAQGDVATAERAHTAALAREQAASVDLAKALGVSPQATRNLRLAPLVATPPLSDLPVWRRDAALSRRDVLRAIADYDIAENALRLQIASQYPAVSLGPSYNYDHGVHKYPMTVGLTLPPWDLNRHAIAQAEATRAAAGRSLELAQANALAAVDAAAAALSAARNDLARLRAADLPIAQRTAEGAARSVSAGETDRVDEMAARGAVLDARINVLDAEHAAATATADLEDALRRSFDPAETAVIQAQMARVGEAR
jgi:CRISPR system Cascade subunit CasA